MWGASFCKLTHCLCETLLSINAEVQQADFLPTHSFSYQQVDGVYLVFLTQVKILFSSFVGRASLWDIMQNIQKYLYIN